MIRSPIVASLGAPGQPRKMKMERVSRSRRLPIKKLIQLSAISEREKNTDSLPGQASGKRRRKSGMLSGFREGGYRR